MFVCLCQGVTDQEIRSAVETGATDLCALADQTGSGTCCGRCHPEMERLINEHLFVDAAERAA